MLGKMEKNKLIIIILVILLLVTIISLIIFRNAYAKMTKVYEAKTTTDIGSIYCEMEVTASANSKTIVNPYCTVKVKNYDSSNNITVIPVEYTVNVVTLDGSELPEYQWQDSNGNVVKENEALTGTFNTTSKQQQTYTIVFKNTGESTVSKKIDFELVTSQK